MVAFRRLRWRSARRHGQCAGDGDEAWADIERTRRRALPIAAAPHLGGTRHLRRRPRRSRHFLLMAGIGLDAHIVYHVSAALKARDRQVRLLGRGLEAAGPQPGGVRRRNRRPEAHLLVRAGEQGAELWRRFQIARNVSLLDDQFEVVLFEGRSTLRYVKYFAGLALNRVVRDEGRDGAARQPRSGVRRRTTAGSTCRSTANSPDTCRRRSISSRTP